MEIDRPPMASERRQAESDGAGTRGLWWGIFLVIAGVLWLGDMARILELPAAVVGGVFAVAGIGFALEAWRDQGRWWAAIPAGALIGLGTLIALVDQLSVRGELGAATLLAASGLGFAGAYVRDHRQWWAMGIAGLLLAVSLIVGFVGVANGTGPATSAVLLDPVGLDGLAGTPFNLVMPGAVLVIGLALVVRALLSPGPGRQGR